MEYKPQRKKKNAVTEPCRLCGLVEKLRFSHIVPEWFYTRLYDEKGRIHVLSTDESSRHKQIQKGLREYLLCSKCEQKLGRWESYARNVFYGNEVELWHFSDSTVTLFGIDYAKFKLCMMSILWRMSISTDFAFKEVSLGLHEDILRSSLFAEDPLTPSQYGFMVSMIYINGIFQPDFMLEPSVFLNPLRTTMIINPVIAGFQFNFVAGKGGIRKDAEASFFSENGTLVIKKQNAEDDAFYLRPHLDRIALHVLRREKEKP